MIAPHNDAEHKTVEEFLSSPNKKEWRKVLEDKTESIRTNYI